MRCGKIGKRSAKILIYDTKGAFIYERSKFRIKKRVKRQKKKNDSTTQTVVATLIIYEKWPVCCGYGEEILCRLKLHFKEIWSECTTTVDHCIHTLFQLFSFTFIPVFAFYFFCIAAATYLSITFSNSVFSLIIFYSLHHYFSLSPLPVTPLHAFFLRLPHTCEKHTLYLE